MVGGVKGVQRSQMYSESWTVYVYRSDLVVSITLPL